MLLFQSTSSWGGWGPVIIGEWERGEHRPIGRGCVAVRWVPYMRSYPMRREAQLRSSVIGEA